MQSHVRKVYVCLAVTCHLHFWQNDKDLSYAAVVTWGWNGYQNKIQHRKLTLEKKILLLLQGFEPVTFQSWVRCSNHWAILLPCVVHTTWNIQHNINNTMNREWGMHHMNDETVNTTLNREWGTYHMKQSTQYLTGSGVCTTWNIEPNINNTMIREWGTYPLKQSKQHLTGSGVPFEILNITLITVLLTL